MSLGANWYNMVSRLAEFVFVALLYLGYIMILTAAAIGIYSIISGRLSLKRSASHVQLA